MADRRLKVLSKQLQYESTATTLDKCQANLGSHKYECLLVTKCGKRNDIGLITLNRPNSMNALSTHLLAELCDALDTLKLDSTVGCVIITGSKQFFSAGADIKQMGSVNVDFGKLMSNSATFVDHFKVMASFPKPLIAAVNGYCFGGGCEIALACDIVYAGEDALFGQPEVKIGTIPGGGGTQRLVRAVGKSKAMEMILSGDPITAQQAVQFGLVSEVFPTDQLLDEAIRKAGRITSNSTVITSMAKECVQQAAEVPLSSGLDYEKRVFQATFFTKDREEGMRAFIEKRRPNYTNE